MFGIRSGWVVSVSGLDGAGKSTLINNLLCKTEGLGIPVKYVQVRFGFTPRIKRLKSKISNKNRIYLAEKSIITKEPLYRKKPLWEVYKYISILDQVLVFSQIRILKSLGVRFITDRYHWDNWIIFLEKFGHPGWFINLHWKLIQFIGGKPTISFMLSLPPSESYDRITERKHGKQEQTLETLIQREKLYSSLHNVELIQIDAMGSREKILKDTWVHLEDLLK